jgi:hypothetical protein
MVQFPAGARDSCLLHSVETGSVAHPGSYPAELNTKIENKLLYKYYCNVLKNVHNLNCSCNI